MSLSIRIINSPAGEAISQWNNFFPEEGGIIGRGFEATLKLSDAHREISASHAIIGRTTRGYQVMDNSTNGLFINGSSKALGKGNSVALNDGDILDICGYRLLVSCFLPMQQGKSQIAVDESSHRLFSDDPFFVEVQNDITPQIVFEPEQVITDIDVIDGDPFLSNHPDKHQKDHKVELDFNALDDDFSGDIALNTQFVVSKPTSDAKILPLAMNERSECSLEQSRIDKALQMALGCLLEDLSPLTVEKIFDDLTGPRFWWQKVNYWNMYKRYFSRQMANHEWHVKFQVYFHRALKLQRESDGVKL